MVRRARGRPVSFAGSIRRMSRPALAPVERAFERELSVAVAAARAAAAIQVERYERLEHIVKKSAKDVVTGAAEPAPSAGPAPSTASE